MDGTVGACEAKTHISALLDRVEGGETLTITRNGRPIARLVPVTLHPASEEASSLVDDFRALRDKLRAEGVAPFSHDEIVGLIREGRKY